MGYKDAIEVAREILERDTSSTSESTDTLAEEILEELKLEEAKSKAKEGHAEDDDSEEDEDEEEVEEGKMPPWLNKKSKKSKTDDEDEEDEVEEGKMPPWLDKKKKGKDDDDDDDEVKESETILDVDDNQDAEGKKATPTPKGKKKAKEPKMKPSKTGDATKETMKGTKEAVSALFSGEDLSEEFQAKATTIFEAAVNEQVSVIEEDLRTQYETTLSEQVEKLNEELTTKLDDYLNYVVEEWMKENRLAVDSGIRSEVSESFMNGLKGLFEQHYIEIPEEKYDVLESSLTKISEMETQLNEQIEKNIELNKELLENSCSTTFTEVCEGLVATEVEKLRSLAEGIEYDTEETYKEKLNLLKESYFSKTNPESSNFEETVLTEVVEETKTNDNHTGQMADYMRAISKHSTYNKLS